MKKTSNSIRQSTNSKHKDATCNACSSGEVEDYGQALQKCLNCGLVVAKDIPTFKELTKLYKEEYFFGKEYFDYKADRKALEKNFRQRVKFLKPYIHDKAKVVEVGCAYGYFLNLIKDEVNWHKGYDITAEGIDYAKTKLGVNACNMDFLEDREIKPKTIDLVCMWDVVEHLGEPHKHIKKAAELLKPGGALSLTTGDVSSFNARNRGLNWRMIHPPTHIYYFNVPSLKHMFSNHSLKVTSVRYKPTYRNTGSVLNQLICNRKAKSQNASLLNVCQEFAKKTKLEAINFPLNLFDVMEVTAVKQ